MKLQMWQYSDRVCEERRKNLGRFLDFDDLLRHAVDDASNISVVARCGQDIGLTHAIQPIFYVDFPTTGDALHNGPAGYRAMYLAGPMLGLAANCQLIAALKPKLLAAVDLALSPNVAKINLCGSLDALSAKIWVRESSQLLDIAEDLAITSWAQEASRGVELAKWGLMAPVASRFEIKGALLDPHGNEIIPTRKMRRHFDIHMYGYS